jgi:hypothetical protein
MGTNGPLFHRNGAKLLPGSVARGIIALVILVGVVEFVLGALSVATTS